MWAAAALWPYNLLGQQKIEIGHYLAHFAIFGRFLIPWVWGLLYLLWGLMKLKWPDFMPEWASLMTDNLIDRLMHEQTQRSCILRHVDPFGFAAQKACMMLKGQFYEGFTFFSGAWRNWHCLWSLEKAFNWAFFIEIKNPPKQYLTDLQTLSC